MQIVDAHHHLWDLDACHYPWLMAKGVRRFFGDPAPIQKNYLVPDLRDDARSYELLDSVHVQVGIADGDEVHETEWLESVADASGLPGAIVAFCDLSADNAAEVLDAQQGFGRVRGVRQIVGRSAEEDASTGSDSLIGNTRWQENLSSLADRGLSFDLQLIPRQVPRIADLLGRTPDVWVALCHCGSPWDQSVSGIASWKNGLALLASLPNVHCKISGFGMFDHDWTTASITPIVESCIDIFGVERCMFGSNFPVDKLHATYDRLWSAYDEITVALSASERKKLFVDNARNFYRLQGG